MDITDQINRTPEDSIVNALSVGGAICYASWGCLHLWAAHTVYQVGAALAPGMVRGRVFQDSWNLLFFGLTAIIVALTLNVRNSALGYWINLGVLAVADTGLILFVMTTLGYLGRDSVRRYSALAGGVQDQGSE